jgi:hypothetical protein
LAGSLAGLTRLNVLLTLAAVKESQQVLVAGCVSGIVLPQLHLFNNKQRLILT